MSRRKDLHVKLSSEERGALDAFMRTHGLSQSQAVRSLLAIGLGRAKNASDALVKAAYAEGYQAAVIEMRRKLGIFLASEVQS